MPRKLIAFAAATVAAVAGTVVAHATSPQVSGEAGTVTPRVTFRQIASVNGTTAQAVATVRSADGKLHLVFQTHSGNTLNGLAAISISPSGTVGPQVSASGWQAGQPGLVQLPNGTLEAIFGAISPGNVSSVWGVTSSDGGASWSAPANVKGGGQHEALAYGSDITAALSAGTPVLTLPQGGALVIQRGLGSGSPNYQLTTSANGSTADAEVATDASTGEVVAAWDSIAGNPQLYMQGASPSIQAAVAVPGQSRNVLELAGRDAGAGVFGAYTADGKHVRLLRYGGGSVAVGLLKTTAAKVLGVATGPDGRIWVMWGDDSGGGLGVTRSNMAVTRFEPLQHLKLDTAVLYRVSGDGRLGPLDLLVDQVANKKGSIPPPGEFYARVLAVLSARVSVSAVKNKKKVVVAHTITVKVTDAGDPVAGAKVAAKGQNAKTNAKGVAQLTLGASIRGKVTVTVTHATYRKLTKKVAA